MKVAELIRREVVSVSTKATIAEVAKKMRQLDLKAIPICESGCVLGIIVDRDIVTRIVANDIEPSECCASLFSAASSVITVTLETDIIDAAGFMAERHLEYLCVVDGSRLVGVVSLADIAGANEVMGAIVLGKLPSAGPVAVPLQIFPHEVSSQAHW